MSQLSVTTSPRQQVSKSRRKGTALIATAALATLAACGNGQGEGEAGADATSEDGATCTPIAEVETLEEGKLTVLVAEHPPFVSMQGGELSGVEGDFLKEIAESLCLELDASSTSFAAVIEGLQNGRADLSAGNWTVNDERRELFEVSDALYSSGMGIVTQNEDWSTVDDLRDKTLGTPQGYLWVQELIDVYGNSNVRQYQTDVAVLDEVKNGRIDAGLVSLAANTWRLSQDQYSDLSMTEMEETEEIPYTQQPPLSVVLIEKGNTELRDATNQIIEDYYESGELEAALESVGLPPETAYPENRDD